MADTSSQVSDSDGLDQARWGLIFDLLSMDVVVAFYDLMGLRVGDSQAFREVLRTVMLKSRREHDANPEQVPYYSTEQVLDVIAGTLAPEVRNHVVWWGRYIFDYSVDEHRALDAWTNLLRYCGNDPTLWEGLSEELRNEILRKFQRSLNLQEYNRKRAEVKSKPLSDWDLHIYVLRGFDDEDPALANGPDTYVSPTIKTYQGYRFWASVLKPLRLPELETLYQNALPIAQHPDNQTLMSPLPHPRKLDVGL
jgi:hypothetical protein